MSDNRNESAFPVLGATPHPGMTLRQWYAGLAMQGYLARGQGNFPADVAFHAIRHADALLAALEPQP